MLLSMMQQYAQEIDVLGCHAAGKSPVRLAHACHVHLS